MKERDRDTLDAEETEDQFIERITGDMMRSAWREKDNPEWVRHWQGNMRLKYRARKESKTEVTL